MMANPADALKLSKVIDHIPVFDFVVKPYKYYALHIMGKGSDYMYCWDDDFYEVQGRIVCKKEHNPAFPIIVMENDITFNEGVK